MAERTPAQPRSLGDGHARADHRADHQVHQQYGALVYHSQGPSEGGLWQILLITSRQTRRWIIPKGWPMAGLTPEQTAAQEAWEEAGVKGTAFPRALGSYGYDKALPCEGWSHCRVEVYPLQMGKMEAQFPECHERRRRWFHPEDAAAQVAEPELAQLIRCFDPRRLL